MGKRGQGADRQSFLRCSFYLISTNQHSSRSIWPLRWSVRSSVEASSLDIHPVSHLAFARYLVRLLVICELPLSSKIWYALNWRLLTVIIQRTKANHSLKIRWLRGWSGLLKSFPILRWLALRRVSLVWPINLLAFDVQVVGGGFAYSDRWSLTRNIEDSVTSLVFSDSLRIFFLERGIH